MLNALRKELETLREACKVGAVLSRRIDDGSGRLRHADEIIDGMLKMLDKAPPTGDIPAFYNLRIGTIQRAPDGFIEFMHVYDGNNQHAQTVYRDPKPRQFWNENDRQMHARLSSEQAGEQIRQVRASLRCATEAIRWAELHTNGTTADKYVRAAKKAIPLAVTAIGKLSAAHSQAMQTKSEDWRNHIGEVKRTSDQSVQLVFPSCRTASLCENALNARAKGGQ